VAIDDKEKPSVVGGAKKRTPRKRKTAKPIELSLTTFLQLLALPKPNAAKLSAAYRELATSFGALGEDAVTAVLSSDGIVVDWLEREQLAVALSVSDEAIRESGGASAKWLESSAAWRAWAEIAACRFITAYDFRQEAERSVIRRRATGLESGGSAADPLLLPQSAFAAMGPSVVATNSSRSPGVFEPPPESEFRARVDLHRLAQLTREAPPKVIRTHRRALGVLDRTIDAARRHIANETSLDADTWRFVVRILASIGRNVEVWDVLQRSREKLIRVGAGVGDATAKEWAEVVALTWCAQPRYFEAMRDVADRALVWLLRSSRDEQVKALLDWSKQSITARAALRGVDDPFWRILEEAIEISPADADWLRSLLSGRNKKRLRENVVIAAEEWEPERLLGEEFGELLESSEPRAALTGIAIAWSRLVQLRLEKELSAASSTLNTLRAQLHKLKALPGHLKDAAGIEVPIESLADAVEAVRDAATRVADLDFGIPQERARGGDTNPWEGDDLIGALKELEFDPKRPEAETDALRDALRERLVEDSRKDTDLMHVSMALLEFPPEAIALIWSVGVEMRNGALLTTIDSVHRSLPFSVRIWDDIVLRYSGIDVSPLPVPAEIARETVLRLRPRLAQSQVSLTFERLEKELRIGREAIEAVSGSLADLEWKIRSVRTRLTQEKGES
jgi:hypothetical protein